MIALKAAGVVVSLAAVAGAALTFGLWRLAVGRERWITEVADGD